MMPMKRRNLWFCSVLAGATLLAACGKKATPPPETPTEVEEEPEPAPPEPEEEMPSKDPAKSNINVSETIRKACGLTDTEAHFGYNSAAVRQSDRQTLKKIADCFMTGPLKGQTVRIVGHADPRGDSEYNMVLGGRRADNVAAALGRAGLDEGQMTTSSRGEMDATGTDEESWARDRRVELFVAEE